jgi:hypothetical protein
MEWDLSNCQCKVYRRKGRLVRFGSHSRVSVSHWQLLVFHLLSHSVLPMSVRGPRKGENYELSVDLNSEYRDKRKDAIKRTIASMTVGKGAAVTQSLLEFVKLTGALYFHQMSAVYSPMFSRICRRMISSKRSLSIYIL